MSSDGEPPVGVAKKRIGGTVAEGKTSHTEPDGWVGSQGCKALGEQVALWPPTNQAAPPAQPGNS
jgi:hypothetical protein